MTSKNDIPEGFTLQLALVDAVPVVEFCASMIVVAVRFQSPLFVAGAACSALAGCGKVAWKVLLAAQKRDVAWLTRQFRYLMRAGMALMLVAVVVAAATGALDVGAVAARVVRPPAVVFFALWLVGMAAMGVMGARLDKRVARNNWVEQIVNAVAQGLFLVGVLIC